MPNDDLQFNDEANEFAVISSFDQIMMHTIKLGELLTAYYKSLKISDKDLRQALVLNYQTMLVSLGVLDIGQPTAQIEFIDEAGTDDNDFDNYDGIQ